MENVGRAIVEIAELIKNPNDLLSLADELRARYALVDEEIKKRDDFNKLSKEIDKKQKDLSALEAKLAFEAEQSAKKEQEAKEIVESQKSENANILAAVNREKDELLVREKSITAMKEEVSKQEYQLLQREQAIVAKENQLRALEEEVLSREDKVNRILDAAK